MHTERATAAVPQRISPPAGGAADSGHMMTLGAGPDELKNTEDGYPL